MSVSLLTSGTPGDQFHKNNETKTTKTVWVDKDTESKIDSKTNCVLNEKLSNTPVTVKVLNSITESSNGPLLILKKIKRRSTHE